MPNAHHNARAPPTGLSCQKSNRDQIKQNWLSSFTISASVLPVNSSFTSFACSILACANDSSGGDWAGDTATDTTELLKYNKNVRMG